MGLTLEYVTKMLSPFVCTVLVLETNLAKYPYVLWIWHLLLIVKEGLGARFQILIENKKRIAQQKNVLTYSKCDLKCVTQKCGEGYGKQISLVRTLYKQAYDVWGSDQTWICLIATLSLSDSSDIWTYMNMHATTPFRLSEWPVMVS